MDRLKSAVPVRGKKNLTRSGVNMNMVDGNERTGWRGARQAKKHQQLVNQLSYRMLQPKKNKKIKQSHPAWPAKPLGGGRLLDAPNGLDGVDDRRGCQRKHGTKPAADMV